MPLAGRRFQGHAEGIIDVARFHFPASEWRHFEHTESFPSGMLPLGDAICRFDPVYGHGMSVAAQQALELHHLLVELDPRPDPLRHLPAAFFGCATRRLPGARAAAPHRRIAALMAAH